MPIEPFQLSTVDFELPFKGVSDYWLICRSPKPVMGVQIPPPLPEVLQGRSEGGLSVMAEELGIAKNPLVRLREYIADVRVEMKRVTWPGKQEIYGTTLMVVLTTILFGIYFWFVDSAFSRVVTKLLDYFLHRRL